MGKKNLKKYKKYNKYKKNKNLDEEDYEKDISSSEKIKKNNLFKDIPTLLEKLSSSDYDSLNQITSILSSYEFSTIEQNSLNKIFTSEKIIISLVNLLNNESYQIKYNSISSLTNILISYSDTDIDKILILNTNFCEYAINLLKSLSNSEKGSKDHIKIVRTIKNLLDLCMLIIDMTESDILINGKINFCDIIYQIMLLVVHKYEFIGEELFEQINKFLGSAFSTIVIRIDTLNNNEITNLFKSYIEKMNNLFNSKNISIQNKGNIGFIMFYINLINFEFFKNNNINLIPGLIEYSFNELTKDDIIKNLDIFSNMITELEKEKNMNTEPKEKQESNDDIKQKIKLTSEEIDSLFNNLKIFQEIITSVDIPLSNSQNKNDINEDEYEEIEDENDDMNNIMKNSDVFDDLVHKALNEILSVNNYEPLKKMINQKIMDNLSILCDIQNKLEDYYINENDKILQMKEELGEIEYLALSIINNIIIKYHNFLNQEYVNSLYIFLGKKINQLVSNIKENEYFLSLVILTLRTLLDKYNGIFKNFAENDYLNMFNIINNVADNFIKCNIIDIISFCAYVDKNWKIGLNLKNLLFSENDIEVLSHVINAFMDIYKNDDLESNKYLKDTGVMELFVKAVPEFKNKLKKAKNEDKMEFESIEYCKETFLNMKRFIKYKEDNFKQLNI